MSEPRETESPLMNVGDAILGASGIASRIARRESDLEELDRVDEAMLDTLKREFHERGDSGAPGFDPSAVNTGDAEFSAESFLVIARDTFRVVQAARSQSDPALAADALDPSAGAALIGELAPPTASRADVAGIDILSAEVLSVGIAGAREQAIVRFVMSGTPPAAEHWTFQRDPSADTAA